MVTENKTQKDPEKTYWRRFAEMSREAKEFTLSEAGIPMPKKWLEAILNELKRQEALLKLAKSKRANELSDADFEKIERMKELRVGRRLRKKESKLQREMRLKYYWKIKELREKGWSWRDIAEYIRVNHHKKYSHTAIFNAFRRLSKEMEKGAGDDTKMG